HETRSRIPDGAVYLARFRRPGNDVLHHPSHVRGIQGKTLCFSLPPETDGDGGMVREEKREGVLRLVQPGEARPAGRRAARNCAAIISHPHSRFYTLSV